MAADPVTAISDLIKTGLEKFVPDANAKIQAQAAIDQMLADNEFKLNFAQIQLNTEEAKVGQNLKTDWMEFFIAAWRPFIGWAGGAALVYNSIVLPASEFVAKVFFKYTGPFPEINTILLGEVLLALLGMGALRSQDKKNSVSNGH